MPNNSRNYHPQIKSILGSLGIVFLMFFSLAFACNEGRDADRRTGSVYQQDTSEEDDDSGVTQTDGSGGPTEIDVKNYVTEYEQTINPVGGISSPISISLSFGQIRFESPRAANEGDRLRKVASDSLYPVIVQYTVNQKFSDGTYPKNKKIKFELYRNRQGGWSAFEYGPVP